MIFPWPEGKPLFFRNRLFLRFYLIITAGWLWEYGKKRGERSDPAVLLSPEAAKNSKYAPSPYPLPRGERVIRRE
jgi:hypothetical protein